MTGSQPQHSQFLHPYTSSLPRELGSLGSGNPLAHSGLWPGHVVHTQHLDILVLRTRTVNLKYPQILILSFHWRSSSWDPGLALCSQCCHCHTCHSDIRWPLGIHTGSLHGERSQALWQSHTPTPWRYMFSGYWAWLGPCTPDPEEFRKEKDRSQYFESFYLA